METVIAASLKLDGADANKTVKSFKQELKEANENLLQIQRNFGPTSEEALKAARNVAELRDSIQEAREVADLFDPGKKFQAFGNVLRTVSGGMTALTGTMALFGAESADVEKALLKVQSALAITEGVNTIVDAGKDFARLKEIAIDAFKGINTAIAGTAIGAIVIAVGLLFSYWDKIKEAVTGVSAADMENLKITRDLVDKEKERLTHISEQDNILKLQGKSERQILEIKLLQIKATIEAQRVALKAIEEVGKKQVDAAVSTYSKVATFFAATPLSGIADALFSPKETIKKVADTTKEAKKGLDENLNMAAGFQLQIKEIDKNANKAAIDNRRAFQKQLNQIQNEGENLRIADANQLAKKQLADQYENEKIDIQQSTNTKKQKHELLLALATTYAARLAKLEGDQTKEATEREKAATATLTKLREENVERDIKNKQDQAAARIGADYDAQKAEIEALKISEDTKTKLLDEALKKRDGLLAQNEQERALAQAEIYKKQVEDESLNMESRLAALQQWQNFVNQSSAITEEQRTQNLKDNSEARKSIDDAERDHKIALMQAIGSILNTTAQMAGESTAAGKVLAVAAATIDTYAAINKTLRAFSGIPIPGYAIAQAIATGIAGLATVKKIVSVQVPKASSASSGSISMPSLSPPPVVRPEIGTTQLPQDQINAIGNAAAGGVTRAFVVESDVTNNQERVSRLNRAARLGG